MASVEQYVTHVRKYGDARTAFEVAITEGMDALGVARLANRMASLEPLEYRNGRQRKRWQKAELTSRERIALTAAILLNSRSERVAERVIRRELRPSSDELRAARRHPLADLLKTGPLNVFELDPEQLGVLFGGCPCSEDGASSRDRRSGSARTVFTGDRELKSAQKGRLPPPPVGARFGHLAVVEHVKHNRRTWLVCKCDYGEITRRHDDWLDAKRAAAHIGVTVNALHKLTAARSIPFEQDGPGCKCWFRRSDLDQWRRGGGGGAGRGTIGGERRFD
jgi:hypothetical protein